MIKPEEGRDFQVMDVGHCFEISSNLLHGILAGIDTYSKKGFEFNWDALRGNMGFYVVPTVGKEITRTKEAVNQDELLDKVQLLEKKNKDLVTTKKNQASQLTRLRNKIAKMEESIKELKKK